MAHLTLKKSETVNAITIDIIDDQNNIQLDVNGDLFNLTWVWDGIADQKEEKKRLLDDIQVDLIYIREAFGSAMANDILKILYEKIDTVYTPPLQFAL